MWVAFSTQPSIIPSTTATVFVRGYVVYVNRLDLSVVVVDQFLPRFLEIDHLPPLLHEASIFL